ncbi:hypothetical protein [Pseudalkalibacillus berkeleyi]|uniref:YpzI family protein n=1 Tax=Pseudalkalibacillus berkeleyi TaxID=1069813 RepID=A0ABS9GZ91_9BACL|nr:hypothetical protein [Pseudalkalibacillus berkeleyi]MCF6136808.1 hypothetical protein [Pseudalkalibacillus berkeleyi]
MSKKNRSKRATQQGAERVRGNDEKEIQTTMSTHDREAQKARSQDLTLGGE